MTKASDVWCPHVRHTADPRPGWVISNRGEYKTSAFMTEINCLGSGCAHWAPETETLGRCGAAYGTQLLEDS
jgi:hypothetical protein